MKQFFSFILFFSYLLSYSQNKSFKNEFGFRTDNDAYLGLGQDRYYTNGLFITFRHAVDNKKDFRPKTIKKTWEAEAGQYLFNANSGSTPSLEFVDRPFAAYLYGSFKLNWFKANEDHFQAGIKFGTIGPDALGREVQQTLHDLVGFYAVKGWEYQVNNEIGINTSFAFKKLLTRGEKNDLSLISNANLGTSFADAGAGFLFRSGSFNKLFNSVSTNSRISNSNTDSIAGKEFFFFAEPTLTFVGYNATLQGGMFNNNKGPAVFKPNRLLFSQELGFMYAQNRWSLNFSVIFQTKELKEQNKTHQYGSVSIFYRFN